MHLAARLGHSHSPKVKLTMSLKKGRIDYELGTHMHNLSLKG
jgi:hypothetical protein